MKLNFLRILSNLNFAIILLLLIATFSVIGTVIEQDQNIDYYYKTYSNLYIYSDINFYQIILLLGLNHVYKTWWFFLLIFIFGTCLISCTFTQQFPLLKLARRANFKFRISQFKNQEYQGTINSFYFIQSLKSLKIKKYNIFQQQNFVYLYKGILGRFAPIIVHIGLLVILTGTVIGAVGNFNCQELIVKGEIFHTQNIISKNILTKVPEFPIRVNDFWVEYTGKNNIKQFYSDLSILNTKGEELIQKTITVNFPLYFRNLTLYQTDWNNLGLRIKLNNQIYQLPLLSVTNSKNLFISYIPIEDGISLIINNLEGNFSLYGKNNELLGIFNVGEKISPIKNLIIFEIISETGLQIRYDPGIPLIYSGFAVLMISSLISYFSYTQFWFSKLKKRFLICASSNRGKLNLKIEFLKIIYKKI